MNQATPMFTHLCNVISTLLQQTKTLKMSEIREKDLPEKCWYLVAAWLKH